MQKSSLIVTPEGWRSSTNLSNTTMIVGQNGSQLVGFNRTKQEPAAVSHQCQDEQDRDRTRPVIGFDRIPVVDLNGTVHLLSDEIIPVSTISGDIIFTTEQALQPVPNGTDPLMGAPLLPSTNTQPQKDVTVSAPINNDGVRRSGPSAGFRPAIRPASDNMIGMPIRSDPRDESSRPIAFDDNNPSSSSSTMRTGGITDPALNDDDLDKIAEIVLNEVLDPILSSTSLLAASGPAGPISHPPSSSGGPEMVLIPVDPSQLFDGDIIVELDPDRDQVIPIGIASPDLIRGRPGSVRPPPAGVVRNTPSADIAGSDFIPVGIASPEQIKAQEGNPALMNSADQVGTPSVNRAAAGLAPNQDPADCHLTAFRSNGI